MKQRRILLSCLLVLALMLTTVAFSSCEMINGFLGNNDVGDGGGNTDVIPDTPDDKPGDSEIPDDQPDGPDNTDPTDVPVLSELHGSFYLAENWQYMTNDDGASLDGGDVPYSMADGSIKFHRANQAFIAGDYTNATVSFMLKGTNDWSIWFNSSSKDNANNSSYRLAYAYGGIRLVLSSAPEQAAAVVTDDLYKKGEWNRFDIVFSTNKEGVCQIKLYINGVRATLAAGDNTTPMVSVADNTLTHTQPAMFTTGEYMVVKVWEAHNYVQIKPVANAEEEDLPIIACIGASITEGAGADNFYTESYPAQLQNALNGQYNVINYGNSGKTVREDLGDVAWLKQYQWQGVQAIVPDIAILNIGTNDSKTSNDPVSTYDSFYEAYKYLIDQLLAVNPDMEIIICTVPYAYTGIWDINNDNIKNIIAPVQRDIAEEFGYTLIDLYEYSQNKSFLFNDGVHPGTRGYEMFVKIIMKALLEGEDALTEEFIASINAEYNDKISGISASIVTSDDAINLVVSGDTELSAGDYLKIYVGTGDENANYYDATIADGKFSATINLCELTKTSSWYNVRVCASESDYKIVLMNQSEYAQGQEFTSIKDKVTLKSWNANYGATLSFVLGDNVFVELDSVVIKEVDGVPALIVEGTTNDTAPKLYVGQHPTDEGVYRVSNDINVGEDGSFTASFDFSTMPIGGWYNVRIYLSDGSYYAVSKDGLTDGENAINVEDMIYCETTKIQIKSWNDGGVATLSFEVTEHDSTALVPTLTVTSGSIAEVDGKIVLTISGTTNDTSLKLLVGPSDDLELYGHDITVADDGSFTVSFELSSLEASGSWQNAKFFYYNGSNVVVTYSSVGVNVDDVFYSENKKITIKTWGEAGILSLSVENYDSSYTLTATEVKFANGKLVFSGTTTNVRSLTAYLYNTTEAIDSYKADAVIGEDGSFTVEIALEQLTLAGGNWYYLFVSVNGGDKVKVVYNNYDKNELYAYGYRVYKWEYWEGIAVNYTDYTYSITNATISEVDGKATLTIEGTMKDSTVAADTITLRLDKTSETKQQIDLVNQSTEAGKFKFVADISELYGTTVTTQYGEQAYFIRLFVDGTKLADVNSRWAVANLFQAVDIGESTYYFMRNSSSAYNTLGLVRIDNSVPTPVLTVSEVKMEDGKLIVTGTAENVETLTVSLFESDANHLDNNVQINTDGTFSTDFSLEALTADAGNWYYLKTTVNGGDATKVVISYDSTYKYAFGYRTYKWENWEGIAVSYSNTGYAYTITNATISEIDGVATLVIEGTTNDATIAAEALTLRLDKTTDTKEQLDVANSATEAGSFRFVYDISALIASTVSENTKEEGYFIRLFKDGSKLADINSAFLSNEFFKEIEIGNSTYYFYRNNASAYYTLGIVRFDNV